MKLNLSFVDQLVGRSVARLPLFAGTKGLKFKSLAIIIKDGVDNSVPLLPHFFEKSYAVSGCNDADMAPLTRYMLRCNTASILKDLI